MRTATITCRNSRQCRYELVHLENPSLFAFESHSIEKGESITKKFKFLSNGTAGRFIGSHLKNDGFWSVKDADEIPYRGGKSQPTKKGLLACEAVGEVNEELWEELERKPVLIPQLASILLEEHWPPSLHQDIVDFIGLSMAQANSIRARNPEFRLEVLRAYERRCAICGYDARLGDCLFGYRKMWSVEMK